MEEQPEVQQRGARNALVRGFWTALGLFCVLLGIIGALLPIMPTTIFLILAVGCFTRSSPRLEAWLLNHRYFGPSLRNWRETGAIHTRAKVLAVGSMIIGYGIFWFGARPQPLLAVGLGLLVAAFAAFVLTRPSGGQH
jgi:uncharacterized membrane protein YbaN (DUF454 family)